MKSNLIDKLFREFDKDKQVIKKNLLYVMDEVMLETFDDYGKATIIIKYERIDKNGKTK
jgi:hypothetical protein